MGDGGFGDEGGPACLGLKVSGSWEYFVTAPLVIGPCATDPARPVEGLEKMAAVLFGAEVAGINDRVNSGVGGGEREPPPAAGMGDPEHQGVAVADARHVGQPVEAVREDRNADHAHDQVRCGGRIGRRAPGCRSRDSECWVVVGGTGRRDR